MNGEMIDVEYNIHILLEDRPVTQTGNVLQGKGWVDVLNIVLLLAKLLMI